MAGEVDRLGCDLLCDRTGSCNVSCGCCISTLWSDDLLISITKDDSLCFVFCHYLFRFADTHEGTEHDRLCSSMSDRCDHSVRPFCFVCLCMIISDLIIVIGMLEFVIGDAGEGIGHMIGEVMEVTVFFISSRNGREEMEASAEIVEELADTEMIGRNTEWSEDDVAQVLQYYFGFWILDFGFFHIFIFSYFQSFMLDDQCSAID